MTTNAALLPLVRSYFEQDPVQAAHSLTTMSEQEAVQVLAHLSPVLASEAVRHLDDGFAATILRQLPPAHFKQIVEKLTPEKGSAIFLHLPNETRSNFLDHLTEKKRKEVQEFLTYPEGSAGRIMSTNFLTFFSDIKIRDAIGKVRQHAERGAPSSYGYVIDHENRLVGVMNMRDLLLASPDSVLEAVMRKDIFTVNCFMDGEEVANKLSERRFFAAPVVDSENRLLGVVKAEQLISEAQEEAAEDIQRMFGVGGDEKAFSSVGFSLRKRLPWLHVNLATAFLAASVVSLFEDIIAKITVLAVYLPVVAGQGGNAGAQSLAIVMRGLVMREIRPEKARAFILKETGIGIVNGLVIGVVTALVAWLWQGNPFLGIVIGLGMIVNLTVAGLTGAAIPLVMKKIGLDPAQCSSIILTTVTDVVGFFSFLGFAVLFQSRLI